jgi:3-deoxy-manno-octulosonate cytidylyltransferase (CMP-KDO synthetase)
MSGPSERIGEIQPRAMDQIVGIIPARYGSTRFPGKPLADVGGKSMIRRVYEQAKRSRSLQRVVVATDDERIREHVRSFGGEAVLTPVEIPSGTDRCWAALGRIGGAFRYVVNIQGDEPFIDPSQIDQLASVLNDGKTEIATLIIPVGRQELLFDPGEAKVVVNAEMEALYFSRSVIPFVHGEPPERWVTSHRFYRQVGMYAYRTDILGRITTLPVSPLEQAESLEQLRWLENGFRIRCVETAFESHCIDKPEDVERILRQMNLS